MVTCIGCNWWIQRISKGIRYWRINVLLILVTIFIRIGEINGQVLVHDDEGEFNRTELVQLFQTIRAHRASFENEVVKYRHRTDVFRIDGETIFTHDGRLGVYRYEEDTIVSISNSHYHGFNFHSKKFVVNDTLYSIGGYGFWRTNADLIYFDVKKREWEIIPSGKTFDGLAQNNVFIQDGSLFVLSPTEREQGSGSVEMVPGLFQYHLGEPSWEQLSSNTMFVPAENSIQIETDNYVLFVNVDKTLIRKSDLSWIRSDVWMRELGSRQIIMQNVCVKGDSILIWGEDNILMGTIDVHHQFTNSNITPTALYQSEEESNSPNIYLGGLALLLLLGVGAIVYRQKGNRSDDTEHPFVQKLISQPQLTLSKEELDEILELSHIQSDTNLRVKRSKRIQEVNRYYQMEKGEDLIIRIPDPQDRRSNLYRINVK